MGLGVGLAGLALEVSLRVVWSSVVRPSETPLLEGLPLGPALRDECLASPSRWLGQSQADPLYLPDPARGVRLRPNVQVTHDVVAEGDRTVLVRTDAFGLRQPAERAAVPGEGALTVLVVGDSFTFGEGVEGDETYPAQLEPLLAAALGQPVRVHNAGVVWIGQHEQRGAIAELVPQLRPDVVLLQFTASNDVLDAMRWRDGVVPLRADPDGAAALGRHPLLTNPLASWSRTYRLFAWRWARHALRYRLMLEPAHLDRAAALIVACREAAHGLPFGVLIAPSVVQVTGGLSESLLGTLRINAGIRERLERAEIPVLDPLEPLAAAQRDGAQPYLERDRHWSPAGNAVIARTLVPFVRELLGERP